MALQSRLVGLRATARAALREGALCRRHLQEALRTESLTPALLRQHQGQQLQKVLLAAAACPHYADKAKALMGLPPEALLEAWSEHWPVLNRADVARLGSALHAPPQPFWRSSQWRFGANTSGSSGAPLRLLNTRNSISRAGFCSAPFALCGLAARAAARLVAGRLGAPHQPG
jgi:hypothetical protein